MKTNAFLQFFSTTSRHLLEASLPSLRIKYGSFILRPFLDKVRSFSNSSLHQTAAYLPNCFSPNHSVDQYLESLCTTLEEECNSLILRCCQYWAQSTIESLISGETNPLQRFHTIPLSRFPQFHTSVSLDDISSSTKLSSLCPSDLFSSLFISLYQQLLHKVTLYELKRTLRECIRDLILSPSSSLISIDYQLQGHESSALVTHNLVPLGNQIIRIVSQEKFLISSTDLLTMITDRMAPFPPSFSSPPSSPAPLSPLPFSLLLTSHRTFSMQMFLNICEIWMEMSRRFVRLKERSS
jgi:hypothetical protein